LTWQSGSILADLLTVRLDCFVVPLLAMTNWEENFIMRRRHPK